MLLAANPWPCQCPHYEGEEVSRCLRTRPDVQFLRSPACSLIRLGLGTERSGSGLHLPATSDRLSALREQLSHFESPYSGGRSRFNIGMGFHCNSGVARSGRAPFAFLVTDLWEIFERPDKFLKDESEMPDPVRIRGTVTRTELHARRASWVGFTFAGALRFHHTIGASCLLLPGC